MGRTDQPRLAFLCRGWGRVANYRNPNRCSWKIQLIATTTSMALRVRRRAAADHGRGGVVSPAALASSTGVVAITTAAARYASGLVLAAVTHWPWVSATVAVVRPQNGHGTPVRVRSGHGRPTAPVCAGITGDTAPMAPAQRPAIVMCSGTEYTLRMTTASPSARPAVRMQRNRTGTELPATAFPLFSGRGSASLTGGAFRYVGRVYRIKELPVRIDPDNGSVTPAFRHSDGLAGSVLPGLCRSPVT